MKIQYGVLTKENDEYVTLIWDELRKLRVEWNLPERYVVWWRIPDRPWQMLSPSSPGKMGKNVEVQIVGAPDDPVVTPTAAEVSTALKSLSMVISDTSDESTPTRSYGLVNSMKSYEMLFSRTKSDELEPSGG